MNQVRLKRETSEIPWDIDSLHEIPRVFPAGGFDESGGILPIFIEGPRWKGKPTRIFAWMGVPDSGSRLPGMVLVHGGGGTAFREWVELWNGRGYAAIAMDTCGSVPGGSYGNWDRHRMGGPPGWGGFKEVDDPVEDQWVYHAVSDIILASSVLSSQPGVDSRRIGLTGISWGGYLSCIAGSIDSRFRFSSPVYGCGHLDLCPAFRQTFSRMGETRAKMWYDLWDPSSYLPMADIPFLWVTGTNDQVYPLPAVRESYCQVSGPLSLSIHLRMAHGHGGPGEKPEEIHALADHLLKGGPDLPRIVDQRIEGRKITGRYTTETSMDSALLLLTRDGGEWADRKWEAISAELSPGSYMVEIPTGTVACFTNLIDSRGLIISSEHVEIG